MKSHVCGICKGQGTYSLPAPGELRRVRERAGLSLRYMARYMSLTPSYVCDVEHGRRRITAQFIDAYLRVESR